MQVCIIHAAACHPIAAAARGLGVKSNACAGLAFWPLRAGGSGVPLFPLLTLRPRGSGVALFPFLTLRAL